MLIYLSWKHIFQNSLPCVTPSYHRPQEKFCTRLGVVWFDFEHSACGCRTQGLLQFTVWLLICCVTVLVWEVARPMASSPCNSCAPPPPSLGLDASEHLDYRSGVSLRNLSSSKLKVRKWGEKEQVAVFLGDFPSVSRVPASSYFHYLGSFPFQLPTLRPSGSSTKPRNNSLT